MPSSWPTSTEASRSEEIPANPSPKLSHITSHRILKATSSLQIPIKRKRNIQHPLNMLHRQRLLLINRQRLRGPDHILNLSPIQIMSCKTIIVFFFERHGSDALEDADALDEHLEDCLFGFGGELAVAEGDVDAGLEGVVEGLQCTG
jgi:hypothetical protein